MIHESKITDAYIICKKADTDSSKEPVLKPGKRKQQALCFLDI